MTPITGRGLVVFHSPSVSAQLKETLTLRLYLSHHFRGFTVACVQYLTPFIYLSPFLLFILLFSAFFFLSQTFTPSHHIFSLLLCLSCCHHLSLPSHVKVLVYWTGLKLSVCWSVTRCWICSARLSSHWLAILNGPTHVWKEPKLFPPSHVVMSGCQYTLPDLHHPLPPSCLGAHTHTQSLPIPLSRVIWHQSWRQVQGYWDQAVLEMSRAQIHRQALMSE